MPSIITTTPCNGFLEDLLGFGERAVQTVVGYKQTQTQQKIDVLTTQANLQAQQAATVARAAEETKAKSRRPLYIAGAVVAVAALYLLSRRRR